MTYPVIELRVLGPKGRPYVELENELIPELEKEGVIFCVPRLYSVPPEFTIVLVQIGVGVSVYALSKVVDRILAIKKRGDQKKTEVTINIEINNYNYRLPEEAEKLKKEYKELLEKTQTDDD